MTENYDNCLFKYLIQQCRYPSGIIGSRMNAIWNKSFHSMTNWGIRDINFSSDDYILDIGCGGGATVNKLAEVVLNEGKVFGIDASKTSVMNSRKTNKTNISDGKVEIIQSYVEDMPFTNDTFNKILAIQTHIYWTDIDNGLKEVMRVLKPSGSFYIICEKDKIAYYLAEYQDVVKMMKLLKSVGFSFINYSETDKWIKYICVK